MKAACKNLRLDIINEIINMTVKQVPFIVQTFQVQQIKKKRSETQANLLPCPRIHKIMYVFITL